MWQLLYWIALLHYKIDVDRKFKTFHTKYLKQYDDEYLAENLSECYLMM